MTTHRQSKGQIAPKRGRTLSWSRILIELTRRGPVHFLLIFLGVVWLVPSFGLLVTSFRSTADIATSGWWTVFDEIGRLNLGNYDQVLSDSQLVPPGIAQNFVNTLIITIPATILPVFLAALAAYGFAWLHFPFRNALYLMVIALLIIPLQTTWVPVLRIYNIFGLAGTWPGIWLAHTAYGTSFAIFLLYNFFADLPGEIFDSARVDGASELTIFFRIVIPLSVPALASLAIFQFVWVWNDLLNALIFLQNSRMFPLAAGVRELLGEYGAEWHVLAAGAFISMIVPLIIFFSLQRYFVRGVTAGAVKG
jgi:alpha-glucoside transport system permease protein